MPIVTSVTGESAHAWTEVYFEGFGWVPFDATPTQDDQDSEPPMSEPEPEPTPEPEPQVGVVSAPEIAIAGISADDGPIVIEADSFELRWRADGDVGTYYVRITDSDGSDIMEPQFTTRTSVSLRTVNLTVDEVYTLSVGVVPVNGEREDMVVSQAQFVRPEEATPEPSEVPTLNFDIMNTNSYIAMIFP